MKGTVLYCGRIFYVESDGEENAEEKRLLAEYMEEKPSKQRAIVEYPFERFIPYPFNPYKKMRDFATQKGARYLVLDPQRSAFALFQNEDDADFYADTRGGWIEKFESGEWENHTQTALRRITYI